MGKQRRENPILHSVSTWLESLGQGPSPEDPDQIWKEDLLSHCPKRFIVYEPMALLPAGSFNLPVWQAVLDKAGKEKSAELWRRILDEISKRERSQLTHLAVSEGIPLHKEGGEAENVMRSPSGLRMLYGEFGPAIGDREPSQTEFGQTLWVSTKQNGIYQTWAPRWTMFSRGNIKEKARLLGFDKPDQDSQPWAVDLYGGIGYFVFSYATLGLRVLCWEINPWSIEGLRRGAIANRWTVKVVQGDELDLPIEEIMRGQERIVVFQEDNQKALERIRILQSSGTAQNILHVNCGFLPTSELTWKPTWDMSDKSSETWFHFHENVGVNDIEERRKTIQDRCKQWADEQDSARSPRAEHVELVKTYAPGVWHCVFDIHVTRSTSHT